MLIKRIRSSILWRSRKIRHTLIEKSWNLVQDVLEMLAFGAEKEDILKDYLKFNHFVDFIVP